MQGNLPLQRPANENAEPTQLGGRNEHRRDYRHADAVGEAVVTFRGKQKSVHVVNISERGVMLKGGLVPEVGEPIAVKFDGFGRMRGIVRWVKERCIGVDLG